MENFPQYNQISHYHNRVRHTSRSKAVYISLLLSFVAIIAVVFVVSVDVNIQSGGVFRAYEQANRGLTAFFLRNFGLFLRTTE